MNETDIENAPLFQVRADVHISANPDVVYAVVSDLPRSGEWSQECTGGRWVSGEPATVAAVFRGKNLRNTDVVAWAPVVRGSWSTEAEVVAAEPERTFRWAMRNSSGEKQDSVWAFDIEPANGGSLLMHHFRMGEPTEGIRGIIADMDETTKRKFFVDWRTKLQNDLAATLKRIKDLIEENWSSHSPVSARADEARPPQCSSGVTVS